MKPSVWFVVGTRPEAIKVAPIIAAMREDGRCAPKLVASGQHVEPVAQVLAAFGLTADRRLTIRRTTGSLAELSALLLAALDRALAAEPAAVVVQGDTTTALIGALAAFWRRIPIVHVEAGLRSGDLSAPFPEEANRALVDHVASLHLAPTAHAAANLAREGIDCQRVLVTGNTVVDAVLWVAAREPSAEDTDPAIAEVERSGHRIMLVTIHRRESWGEPMRRVLGAVRSLVETTPDLQVVLPVHPNPAVRRDVEHALAGVDRIVVCQPLPYAALVRLLARSYLVLSDSGGIQEEAPSFGVPVLVLREVTERAEAVEAGCARLVGTDPRRITTEAAAILADPANRAAMVGAGNPFGDGRAARRSVEAIAWFLGLGDRPTPFDATGRDGGDPRAAVAASVRRGDPAHTTI